jgi:hypothetical protein
VNVFAVSDNPQKCARALDDKRLNKMILETAQILCAVINIKAGSQVTPYKVSHAGHPITLWAMKKDHQRWLYRLGIAYGEEIIFRKGRKHSSHAVLEGLTFNQPYLLEPIKNIMVFFNGARRKDIGLDFTHLPVHKAYRRYLNARWPGDVRVPVWTKRKQPKWCKL